MAAYDFTAIEKRVQERWNNEQTYKTHDAEFGKKKLYCLDMFPYPSGAGLHVGHPSGYIGTDIFSRFHRMNGYEVLHPMGWDAFGLPAENYAIKTKVHPKVVTEQNISNFKKQVQAIGFDYDWSREINTTDPDYYRWTQWIFLQLFKKDLAYEAKMPINWCPSCKTGLANEEVKGDGTCDRCDSKVGQKMLRQWILKITEYADRLLEDLEELDWPESIKEMQRNWIGRSTGATFGFEAFIAGKSKASDDIRVFTTRVDTVFGVSFVAIAPEHPLVHELTISEHQTEIEAYVEHAKKKSNLERTELQKEKTGVFTGSYAKNPFNGAMVPIYVCDYVLGFYGTGAVMAVPAHDERDWLFAEQHGINIERVIVPAEGNESDYDQKCQTVSGDVLELFEDIKARKVRPISKEDAEHFSDEREQWLHRLEELNMLDSGEPNEKAQEAYQLWKSYLCTTEGQTWMCTHSDLMRQAYTNEGILVNSGSFSGLTSHEAKQAMCDWLEQQGLGEQTVNYKLRDWVFSRQRYWGEPIPVVHCDHCGVVAVPEDQLPLTLPEVENYEPSGTGESPLAAIDDWVNTTCPTCNSPAKRETNTMPQWAGSCWYYLRFIDPHNTDALADSDKLREWLPVDMYVGGAEHAVLHLLYARFWHKVLYDIGAVPTKEPFQRLINQGLILAEDGTKMSKSKGNVVNPDDVVAKYGADAFRTYLVFMGPFEGAKPWSESKIQGVERFLNRAWAMKDFLSETPASKEELLSLHQSIKAVTEYITDFKFNTCVSQLMIFVNGVYDRKVIHKDSLVAFLKLLAPFAPHITEALYEELGHTESIHTSSWPIHDESLAVSDTITIVVQVNGKVRAEFTASKHITQEEAIAEAKTLEGVQKYLEGVTIRKAIYVPQKLVSLVAS